MSRVQFVNFLFEVHSRRYHCATVATVLIVDDEPDIRAFLDATLTDEGYGVLHAANGAEALAALRARPADLILLDLFMPVMDGSSFIAAYRREPGPHAPIVAISASTKVLGAGAQLPKVQAHLDKPFELQDLLDTVRRLLARHGGAEPTS